MRKLFHIVTKNRKRKVAAFMTSMALIGGVAFASYLLIASGSTTASGTLGQPGTQSVDLTNAGIPAGLMPGQTANVSVHANNTGPQSASIQSLTASAITVTGNSGNCPSSWFTAGPAVAQGTLGTTFPLTLPSGQGTDIAVVPVTFTDDGHPDQNGCGGATLSVTISTP